MSLSNISPAERLELQRGDVVVSIPVFGSYDMFAQCLHSVLKNTATDVPVLIADDASPDPAIERMAKDLDSDGLLEHTVYYMRQPENVGFVKNMNCVFAITANADVVILNSDCVVPSGWLEALRAAAYSDSQVATASALTNNGTILSVPYRNRPQPMLPQDWSFDQAAEAIRAGSPKFYPQIPTGVGHCLYVRRAALELVGDFDEAFSPGYGEEVDFSQRCVLAGLQHVVADDVLVLHYGCGSFRPNGEANALQTAHDAIISDRYRYYDEWVDAAARDDDSGLAGSIAAAARALHGLSITIDGRILTRFVTGTQLYTLELIAALSKRGDLHIRVLVPIDLGDYARDVLESLPVLLMLPDQINEHTERSDIVHRPYQIMSTSDLDLLAKLGERLIITQLDLIAYQNPGYHDTFAEWWAYRQTTKTALALADEVFFLSRHAARMAVADNLIGPERAAVAYLGTDHELDREAEESRKPRSLETREPRPFLLYLGTDFRHKNRLFALRLLKMLRESYAWDGDLVFAGAHVASGSSAGGEAGYLAANPDLETHVVDLAAIDEAEKLWLYREAAALVYPSVYEGFGLPPFEAAELGTPCLFASQSSLGELMPDQLALLVPWDAEASAARAAEILNNPTAAREHVDAVKATASVFTWDRTARDIRDVYERIVIQSTSRSKALRDEFSMRTDELESQSAEIEQNMSKLVRLEQYDAFDRILVGPDGVLPLELRRALLGIGNRRVLRALVYGPLMGAYRFAYFLKHGRSARKQAKQLTSGSKSRR